jgi:hypothetical protein
LARDEKVCHWGVFSGRGACLGDLTPNRRGSLARSAPEVSRDGFGIGNVEEVRDLVMSRQKPLRLSSGFESLHDPFASSCRLMRILRAIVQTFMLAVFDVKAHLRPCGPIGSELVRDHDARRRDRRFQELCHEPLRSASVPAALDQDVENETILINGAPKPVLLAGDRNDDLIHMPFVAACRRTLADLVRERLPNFFPHWRTVS